MDPFSQAVVGSVAAGCAGAKKDVRMALLAGGVAGMLADLDVLIRSESDPLMAVEFHRHFTHALFFIPFGGLIGTLLLWPLMRRRVPWRRLYLFTTLGYATSGLLDACTSYGTHLLWPFTDARTAWNIISIIDPVFTGALLAGVMTAFVSRRRVWAAAAALFGLAYLGFGSLQHARAIAEVRELAARRGHDDVHMVSVKPSIGNLLLWRGLYGHDGQLHIDAIRVPYLGGEVSVYEGAHTELLELGELLEGVPEGSALEHDLQRFAHFSDHYLIRHPEHPDVLADARYAMLPDSLMPLWGIEIDRSEPSRHAPFESFREIGEERLERFRTMLLGRPVGVAEEQARPENAG
ncbi:MAG: metal-dependent hydrolase [Opitutales bacterium]